MKSRTATLLMAVVAFSAMQFTSEAQEKPQLVATYISPSGWPIPEHSRECEKKVAPQAAPKLTESVNCGHGKVVFIPWYSLNTDGSLFVSSRESHTENLYVLKRNGVRYGYTAMMFGVSIASATQVTWLDEDGSGKFTKLILGTPPAMPSWDPGKLLR